jgi:hypothetical protein
MKDNLDTGPTTKSVEKQLEENQAAMVLMQKSVAAAVKDSANTKTKLLQLEASQQKGSMPRAFLGPLKPFVKSFDEHIEEDADRAGVTYQQAYDRHMDLAQESLSQKMGHGFKKPQVHGMAKSFSQRTQMMDTAKATLPQFKELQKSFGTEGGYDKLVKSILGDSGDPNAPGTWFNFLEENLSRIIQRIMLENVDATALRTIPTSITSNIIPEIPQLLSSGGGYGKGTLGFEEGKTPQFGGGQLMDRVVKTLTQRGIRAAVTELLIANRQKLVDQNPLALERELRILEFNLSMNTDLLYGDDNIHQDAGDNPLEVSGFVQQIEDASTGFRDHVWDWDGTAFDETTNNPLNIFREVAERLVVDGHIPGGMITGRYSVLMDYGVANNISTVIDSKQRLLINEYAQTALIYGQAFSGFATDLGVFKFERSKTLFLTENDTWTLDDNVSPKAIISTLAGATLKAVPTSTSSEKEDAGQPNKADLPTGAYRYRVSVVNDQGESNISDAFVTTTDGSTPADIAATQTAVISIPYESEFAGGLVASETVTPARYFLIYRANADEVTDSQMSCIAKVAINGTSTTTYVDWNQKIPKTTDMFFISNAPLDIAHCSLTPSFEIPLYDPNLGTTRQWQIMNIGGLCMWAPVRQFLVKNVPGFTRPT